MSVFGVICYRPKHGVNVGTLWRSAKGFGASYLGVIAGRVERQPSDTARALHALPVFTWPSWEVFMEARPWDAPLVAVELTGKSVDLCDFDHPVRACYLLGAEDDGIPPRILNQCQHVVTIPAPSLNLATAGSIVLYDRIAKED